jgi:hypothetical protein
MRQDINERNNKSSAAAYLEFCSLVAPFLNFRLATYRLLGSNRSLPCPEL